MTSLAAPNDVVPSPAEGVAGSGTTSLLRADGLNPTACADQSATTRPLGDRPLGRFRLDLPLRRSAINGTRSLSDRGATQVGVSSMIHSPPTSRRRVFPQLGQRRFVASRSTSPGALIVDSTRAPQFGQASWLTSSLVLTVFAT